MTRTLKIFTSFALSMLLLALVAGAVAAFAFLYPEEANAVFPFYQLRPVHVSAALFWIISGAVLGVLFYRREVFKKQGKHGSEKPFVYLWMGTIVAVFGFYAFRKFGGREYWEFPPVLAVPILGAWLLLMRAYFKTWSGRARPTPLYVWMWTTGIVAFLVTFLEQNLYHIPWFRESYLRAITVQWKSNGAMVGAWNQMIYGTSLFVMAKLSGDEGVARDKKAFFFYFLGLTNLMFNWGHHIYNVPGASWIRHVSYAISMTEWIIFISIIQGFKSKMSEVRKFRHRSTYRFLMASEGWIFANLTLALFMSIPAVNRYTHGTHITVAHAMGATVGINTMILLSSIGYMLKIDDLPAVNRQRLKIGFIITQVSLGIFWLALIVAGILKGYRETALGMEAFGEMMRPVLQVLHMFAIAGIALAVGVGIIVWQYFGALKRRGLTKAPKQAALPAMVEGAAL